MEYNPKDNPIIIKCKGSSTLPIDRIMEFQGNLKKLTTKNREKLCSSICIKGFIAPFFVWDNQGDYSLLDGHQRIKTLHWMREKGWDIPMLPIVFVEAENEKDAREKLMAITSQFGEFETSELMDWLDDFDDSFKESIRLVDQEIEIETTPAAETTGDDDVPEAVEPITKLGDLWELGEHRLLCGDSTDAETVAILMDGQNADMVFTDPPYLLNTEGGCKGEIGKSIKKYNEAIEFISDFNPLSFLPILPTVFNKKKMNAYIFCNKDLLPDYLNWAKETKNSFNVLVWKKPNAVPIGDSHRPDIEYLLLFRKSAIWNNGLKGVIYSRVLEYGRESGLHPTMKPIDLIVNEMLISSNKKSIVVDFFGGSGSTLIASERIDRLSRLIEKDPHYCDVIVTRYKTWCENNDRTPTIKLNGEVYNG